MLVRFLYEGGLPYLGLRTAIRSNNSAFIDSMYAYMLPRFRGANKYLYSKLCAFNIHTGHILRPDLKKLWEKRRTVSLRGNKGRNVGWDFALERFNLEVQLMLGNHVSGDRIQEVIRMLNGIRHVRAPTLQALGIEDDGDLNENSRILNSDVNAVVSYLKKSFGFNGDKDADKVMARHANQFSLEGTTNPWTRIGSVEASEPTRAYLMRILKTAPRGSIM
jgi:hypothetical protein